MAESCYIFYIVLITGLPALSLVVGTEFDHAERHGGARKLHPPAVVIAYHAVNIVNGLLLRVRLYACEQE
jgi:hypothetical protein